MDRRTQALWVFFGAMSEVRTLADAGRLTAREVVARLRVNLDRATVEWGSRRSPERRAGR